MVLKDSRDCGNIASELMLDIKYWIYYYEITCRLFGGLNEVKTKENNI